MATVDPIATSTAEPARRLDVRQLRRREEPQGAAVGRAAARPARSRCTSILFVAMWVKTIWEIEQLDKPKIDDRPRGRAAAAAAAAAAAGWREAARRQQITPKKIKVKDIVQPVKIEKQEATADRGQGRSERRGRW